MYLEVIFVLLDGDIKMK